MLIRHTAYYALARIVPGLLNFLAIAAYTRMLSPGDYGVYAVTIAWIGLANVLCFQWLRLALLRFFQANKDNPDGFLGVIFFAFILVVLVTGGAGLVFYATWADPVVEKLILLAVPLTWIQAWFDLNLELARSRLEPVRYGLMSTVKAVVFLSLGIALIFLGFRFYAPLLGLFAGMLAASIGFGRQNWRSIPFAIPSKQQIWPLLAYGMPLMATFALAFVVSNSDRLILAWLLGEAAAGTYSAGYDIAFQVITLLMVTVNLAGYPLAVKKMEDLGHEAARQQLAENGTLLLLVAVPVLCVFLALAPQVVTVLLGERFREGAVSLVPWVALAAFFAGIRAYHFDLAFQLSRKTMYQVGVTGVAALTNVVLNYLCIPLFGIVGAAYATLVAYLVALVLSLLWGRKLFSISLLTPDTVKICLSGGLMVASLWPLRGEFGLISLAFQVVAGGLVYAVSIFVTNVLDIRKRVFCKFGASA